MLDCFRSAIGDETVADEVDPINTNFHSTWITYNITNDIIIKMSGINIPIAVSTPLLK